MTHATDKIISIAMAEKKARAARRAGKRVVTTNGCFDLLHIGHVRNLAYAKSLGDILIVGINSDASTRRQKGPARPIVPARERAEMLASFESVDYVFVFDADTPLVWIQRLQPAVHVKGSDRSIGRGKLLESEAVEQSGGTVALFRHTGKHSTSGLIKRVLAAYQSRKPERK